MKFLVVISIYFLICGGVVFFHWYKLINTIKTKAVILKTYSKSSNVGKFSSENKMALIGYDVDGKKMTFETDFNLIEDHNDITVFYKSKNPEEAYLNSKKAKWMSVIYSIIFITIVQFVIIVVFVM